MSIFSVVSVTSDTEELPSDGSQIATVTATIHDELDAPAPVGTEVKWAVTPSGDLSDVSSLTNDVGVATTTLTATEDGEMTITATTTDDTNGKTIVITGITAPSGFYVFSVKSDKSSLPSDGSLAAKVTAIIHDANDAPAPAGTVVNWVATGGELSEDSSITDDLGAATIDVTANVNGIVTITATTTDDTNGKKTSIFSSPALLAPTVSGANEADRYTIDYYDLQLGVQMIIPHYLNATTGDTVTFYWGDYSHSTTLTNPSKELPMVINISSSIPPVYLNDGDYAVYYTVSDTSSNVSYSSALPIKIINGGQTAPTLAKPLIPAGADGYINISDAINGVVVNVSYSNMAEGDFITLYWLAVDSNNNSISAASSSFTYTAVDGDNTHAFTVEMPLFFPNADEGYQGSVKAYYTVMPEGASTLMVSFETEVEVDTVPPGYQA